MLNRGTLLDSGLPRGNATVTTRQEFEIEYAKNSGVTVEYLRAAGLLAIPCNCGEEGCRGWQMRHWENLDEYEIQSIPEIYRVEIEQFRKAVSNHVQS